MASWKHFGWWKMRQLCWQNNSRLLQPATTKIKISVCRNADFRYIDEWNCKKILMCFEVTCPSPCSLAINLFYVGTCLLGKSKNGYLLYKPYGGMHGNCSVAHDSIWTRTRPSDILAVAFRHILMISIGSTRDPLWSNGQCCILIWVTVAPL